MKKALSAIVVFALAIVASIAVVGINPVAGEKAATGIDFDGSNDYVTFGVASDLGASTFTIETWFKREGTGKTTTTGSGGITKAIPLVTKGRGEAENSNKDMNYFLGIDSTLAVLAADFEEGAGGSSPGLNHPIKGVTPIVTGYWYHAAVTYDGTKWQLFLNGGLENELTVGQPPRHDSIQHSGLASAMTSTGAAAGYFNGLLDEVRIWNRAKSQQAIQDSMYLELTSGSGLLGRWGLNEGSGTTANNSVSGGSNGTLTNGPVWVDGSPFELKALDFGTGTAYVTFGDPAALDLAEFTLETWFKREGAGTTASSGGGGVVAIPLVTKGRGEAEASNKDMNYFFGIRGTDNVLCADFEEGAGGSSPGLNHPVIGHTAISNNIWYHAAVTYDGTTWRLYLNGNLDADSTIGQPPQSSSIQHAGLATAMNSSGVIEGHFDGVLDEVRIWNYARSDSAIQATISDQITAAQSGLVARWGLDEAYGDSIYGSAGTAVHGPIMNAGYGWVEGAPFNISFLPPEAPTALSATAISYHQIDLSWTDNADNEAKFEIERSSVGASGPFTLIDSVAADITAYSNYNLLPETEYWYRVRATNAIGNSGYSNVDSATTLVEGSYALDFGTGSAYATFGSTGELGLAEFTLEAWFKREGTGTAANTGGGGFYGIPLVTKGRGEAEGSNVDMNYFLGIHETNGVIAADFEDMASGLNHPVIGHTVIANDAWYHVAATYDGTTWRLYLNGSLEADSVAGQTPRYDSIQHAGLGTAMTSTGATQGHLDGVLDEVRIWNYARSDSAIVATMNSQLSAPQTGLVARWGLNEGSGAKVYGSAGTAVNGDIINSGYSWVTGAPFNLPTEPPDAPTDLSATATIGTQIVLEWADNSDNETGFHIQRSTSGGSGPFDSLASVGANISTYTDWGLNADAEYWYRVRAKNGFGHSSYTNVDSAITPADPNNALDFGGTDGYVTFGDPAALDLPEFTIEAWFQRQGTGTTTTTGSGGITNAIPLVSKGRGEADGSNLDMNYILGIDNSTGVVAADFEEDTSGTTPGLNHPIFGVTPIVLDTWYHAAATYDGTTWKLYLNGELEDSLVVGLPPRWDSIQHAGLGSALTSTGVAEGFFDGVIDEARIWDYARTGTQIRSTINSQITAPQAGLKACWGLNEGTGTAVHDTSEYDADGTVTGSNWAWGPGAPFDIVVNEPPDQPDLVSPPDMGTGVSTSPTLEVTVSDLDEDTLTVNFYGRATSEAGADFTLVILPDTQFYSAEMNGGTLEIFQDQIQWITDKKDSLNIVYVAHLGDCVQNGDSYLVEWERADTAMSILETIMAPDGMPFGVSVGNHDQTPNGDPDGTTTYFNQFFGESRFSGRGYYGGHYGSNNDNQYQLFGASGLSFIVIYLEYDTTPDTAVMNWADSLLAAHSARRGIVISHYIIGTGDPGSFSAQGTAIYNALKDNPNLFLMHCGHISGEGKRTDVYNGNTVHTVLADYQDRTNGGDGWLRIMEFSLANNQIQVRTYSPTLDSSETDANSQFILAYDMEASDFTLIGTDAGVPSGSNASVVWPGLSPSTEHEWYVEVSDGIKTTSGPAWSFTTGSLCTLTVSVVGSGDVDLDPPGGIYNQGTDVELTAIPDSGWAFDGWSGDLGGSANPDTITMDADKTVTAAFYTQPSAVENLSIQAAFDTSGAGSQDIWLAWSPVDDDTAGTPIVVSAYAVYRDTVPSFVPGPATEYDTASDTTYLDIDVAGDSAVNYYYYVNARKGGLESDDSQCVGEFDTDLITAPKAGTQGIDAQQR